MSGNRRSAWLLFAVLERKPYLTDLNERPVAAAGAPAPEAAVRHPPGRPPRRGPPRGGERRLLPPPGRADLAARAARLPAVADRVRVLPGVAAGRHLGAGARGPAGGVPDRCRPAAPAPDRPPGQPDGEDDPPRRRPRVGRGGNKVPGRERFALVDSLGLVWALRVTTVDVQDRDGGRWLQSQFRYVRPSLREVIADRGFSKWFVEWVRRCGWRVTVTMSAGKGFTVPRGGGGRADVRVAGLVPPARQGPRVPDRDQKGDDRRPHDPPDGPTTPPAE